MNEAMASGLGNGAEQLNTNPMEAKTYREIGAQNRAEFNKKIAEKKAWLGGWMKKATGWLETGANYAAATPNMAMDGAKAIDTSLVTVQEKLHKGLYDMSDTILTQKEKSEIWVDKKVAQASNFAEITKWLAEGAKDVAIENFDKKTTEMNNFVAYGLQNRLDAATNAINSAKAKARSKWDTFIAWKNNKRLEAVQNKEDAARAQLAAAIQEKNALQIELFGNQGDMAMAA